MNPRSWTLSLQINVNAIFVDDWKSKLNQFSPLYFASELAAYEWAKKIYEPPLSVSKWIVIGSDNAPNFPFKQLINREVF